MTFGYLIKQVTQHPIVFRMVIERASHQVVGQAVGAPYLQAPAFRGRAINCSFAASIQIEFEPRAVRNDVHWNAANCVAGKWVFFPEPVSLAEPHFCCDLWPELMTVMDCGRQN